MEAHPAVHPTRAHARGRVAHATLRNPDDCNRGAGSPSPPACVPAGPVPLECAGGVHCTQTVAVVGVAAAVAGPSVVAADGDGVGVGGRDGATECVGVCVMLRVALALAVPVFVGDTVPVTVRVPLALPVVVRVPETVATGVRVLEGVAE